MRPKTVGAMLVVVSLAFASVYYVAAQSLMMREQNAGIVQVGPGEFGSFPFRVFGVASEVAYSFLVESGPHVSIFLMTARDFERYIAGEPFGGADFVGMGDVAQASGSFGSREGVYRAVIENAADSSDSAAVRYNLLSTGYASGSVGAALYLSEALTLVIITLAVFAGVLLLIGDSRIHAHIFCPYCGRESRDWRCNYCGHPRPVIWSRKW